MDYKSIPQRSDAWFAARLGRLTASRVNCMMARAKGGPAASREKYMWQLALERVLGRAEAGYTSPQMLWGTEQEPFAREAYSQHRLVSVEEVGFLLHPTLHAGASPDGIVGQDTLLELKCPDSHTHGRLLLGIDEIPTRYHLQMQFQLACAGPSFTQCDFLSFDPRMPENSQIFLQRVERDDAKIREIEEQAAEFLADVDRIEAQLRDRQSIVQKDAA